MGKKLSIIDLTSAHHMSGMAGFYTPSKVTIELDPYGTYSEFPHEYGHMIFMTVLPKFYNSTTLKNEWNALIHLLKGENILEAWKSSMLCRNLNENLMVKGEDSHLIGTEMSSNLILAGSNHIKCCIFRWKKVVAF